MYVRTQDGQPQSAAVVPLVNGQWGGQLYGRYEVRFRSDEIPGYKLAFLLWPDTNNWAEGEIDFPEIGSLESGNTLYANVFPKGDLATGYPGASVGFTTETEAANSGWHTRHRVDARQHLLRLGRTGSAPSPKVCPTR